MLFKKNCYTMSRKYQSTTKNFYKAYGVAVNNESLLFDQKVTCKKLVYNFCVSYFLVHEKFIEILMLFKTCLRIYFYEITQV